MTAEQELRNIIQEAWNDGDNNPKDKFGDFLTRSAKKIIEAGYKSPEECQGSVKQIQNMP